MSKLFPTYEIGSLPKLNARVRALVADPSNPVTDKDIQELVAYSSFVGVDTGHVAEILRMQMEERRKLSPAEREAVVGHNALLNLKLQENAGLDFVYDGEARRTEMYRHVATQVDGFVSVAEPIRSRGPDGWIPSICIAKPRLKGSLDELPVVKEFDFVQRHVTKAVKIPIDDPYMVANMTLDRYFHRLLRNRYPDSPRALRYAAKRELTLALAENVIRPQVDAAVKAGAKWVQLDIPSATIDIEHIPIMVEGVNAVVMGFEGVKFSVHFCYPKRVSLTDESGYELLFPHVLKLDPKVDHFSLELANANQYEKDLEVFAGYQDQRRFEIGAGLVDITKERQKRGQIETPEIVRDRIARVVGALKDPSLVYAVPDCGLRQLGLARALQLYDILVKGAEFARRG